MRKLAIFALLAGATLWLSVATAAAQQVTWQVGHATSASHWGVVSDKALAKDLAKATDGEFKLTIFPGGSLYKGPDSLDAVSDNLAQMYGIWGSHVAGEEQIMELFDLPMFVPWDFEFRSRLWQAMTPEFRKLLKERYNVYLMGIVQAEPRMIYTKQKVTSLDDLEGQKIRAMGPVETEFTRAIGAVPVPVNWSETYTALQQGLVDGNWVADAPHYFSKLYEVTNYIFDINNAGAGYFVVVSQEALDNLPAGHREALLSLEDEHMARVRQGTYDGAKDGRKWLMQEGMEPIDVPKQDMAYMRKVARPIVRDWADRLDPEARRIYEKAKAMIAEHRGR